MRPCLVVTSKQKSRRTPVFQCCVMWLTFLFDLFVCLKCTRKAFVICFHSPALFKLLDWTGLRIYTTTIAKRRVHMRMYILSTCLLLWSFKRISLGSIPSTVSDVWRNIKVYNMRVKAPFTRSCHVYPTSLFFFFSFFTPHSEISGYQL